MCKRMSWKQTKDEGTCHHSVNPIARVVLTCGPSDDSVVRQSFSLRCHRSMWTKCFKQVLLRLDVIQLKDPPMKAFVLCDVVGRSMFVKKVPISIAKVSLQPKLCHGMRIALNTLGVGSVLDQRLRHTRNA